MKSCGVARGVVAISDICAGQPRVQAWQRVLTAEKQLGAVSPGACGSVEEVAKHATKRGDAGLLARHRGLEHVAGSFLPVFEMALLLEDAQVGAHRGVAGRIGEVLHDLRRRGRPDGLRHGQIGG